MARRRIRSFGSDVSAFMQAASATPSLARGRMIVAIDATASREPTWEEARRVHADLFDVARRIGGLDLQLVWFNGRRDFGASPWLHTAEALKAALDLVECRPGFTQIERVQAHAALEAQERPVHVLTLVGDAVEENHERLYERARILAVLGVPMFILQEGQDAEAAAVFRRLAEMTAGSWCAFDAAAPEQLRPLMLGASVFAAGGRAALAEYSRRQGGAVRLLARRFEEQQ